MSPDRMPDAEHPLQLAGAYGSPYSLKMRAVLRYRRLPFRWVLRDSKWDDLVKPSVLLLPAISWPDEQGAYPEAMVDSSPQIVRLEAMTHDRSIVPVDPAVAFIDALVEDYADEWVTKAMYHYRWFYDACVDKAGSQLPLTLDQQMDPELLSRSREFIIDRQQSRMAMVGSTEENRPVIESSYERLLDLLDSHLATTPFVLGHRPGRGDFGLFGQLSQLVIWDPESARVAVERAPRLVNWVMATDDLSWLPVAGDEGWDRADSLAQTVPGLLEEIGRTYVPFLLANAEARDAGADEVFCEIDGLPFRQAPFGYQVKCLTWLREGYHALDGTARETVDSLLAGTGCDRLFG